MRKIYSLMITLLPITSFAQDKIGYSYDAAGYRVKREIIMSAPKVMAKQQTISNEGQNFSDMLCDHNIKIYPNPTEGTLRICISGIQNSDDGSLTVYTSQGAQILSKDIKSENIDIDISSQPSGIYLLRIIINKNSSTWKIIKK